MNIEFLREKLVQGVASEDSTISSRFKHHRATLNNLIKHNVIDEDNIELDLIDNFDDTFKRYKTILIQEDPDKKQYSALSRAKALSQYCSSELFIKTDELSFSEVLMTAIKRKYGEKIWTEKTPKANRKKLMEGYTSLMDIGIEMITAAVNHDDKLWTFTDSDKKRAINRASVTIRGWATGKILPATRISDDKVTFIENFLNIPKNGLLSKIKIMKNIPNQGKHKEELSTSRTNRREYIENELNTHMQKLYDEYSAFKINSIQPEIINIPNDMKGIRHPLLVLSMHEETKRSNKNWTVNASGKYGSLGPFLRNLKTFQDHCIRHEGLKFSDITTEHLTNPAILHNLINKSLSAGYGLSSEFRLLNFINISCQSRGYLTLCADKGDRNEEEFNEDLDVIKGKYKEWNELLEGKSKDFSNNKNMALKGKEKVLFLIKMDKKERRKTITDLSDSLMSDALTHKKETLIKLDWISNLTTKKDIADQLNSAALSIKDAFIKAQYSMLLAITFVNIPRAINWTTLKYYKSASEMNTGFSSLTYHRQKNRFQLFIPTFGKSLVDDNASVRHLKNAGSNLTSNIDVLIPESKSAKIKEFLEIRELYIEHFIKNKLPKMLVNELDRKKKDQKAIDDISKQIINYKSVIGHHINYNCEDFLNELGVPNIDKIKKVVKGSDRIKYFYDNYSEYVLDKKVINQSHINIMLNDLTTNLELINANIDRIQKQIKSIDSAEILFIWLAYKAIDSKDPNRLTLKEHFIQDPGKLGQAFDDLTYKYLLKLFPDIKQNGINIHALRHIVAIDHLETYPGDYTGAGAKLNDTVEQIIKTYGNKDVAGAMQRVADLEG